MELETQILLSESFGYILPEVSEGLLNTVDEVNRMIFGMIKKL